MDFDDVFDKIKDIVENYNWLESKRKVLVMHLSLIDELKDYITYVPNNMELGKFKLILKFDNIEEEVFPSFRLPKYNYCWMEFGTYEEYYKPKN